MASKKSVFDLSPEKMSLLKRLRERERVEKQNENENEGVSALRPRADRGPAPLSFAQQRLWFVCQLEPSNPLYNLPGAVRLSGPLDEPALGKALDALIERHHALRTRFVSVAGEPFAEVLPVVSFPLRRVELTEQRKGDEAALMELVTREARAPFDLSEGPLARALLIRCGHEEHVLVVTIHHIATDGWSSGIFMKELSALYEAFHGGATSCDTLAELPVQYEDFAAWQREWLSGERLEAQLAFWREQLAEPAVLELPLDRSRPRQKRYRGGRVELALPPDLSSRLRKLSRERGASLFMVLLAAFDVLMWRYTRQDDVIVGTSFANRNRREIEPLMGFFVNTLAIRARLDGNPTFGELLAQVRETVLLADAHQDVPFDRVVEALEPERDPARNPFFEIVLDLQRAPRGSFSLSELTFRPFEFETGTTRFDLEAHLVDGKEAIEGFFRYDADLFEHPTMQALVRHYRLLLESIAENPERPIGALAILDEDEQRRLREWNATSRDYPGQSIAELFRLRAAERPESTALVYRDAAMSYREVDERSERLARYLRSATGVDSGGRVGVCLDRSFEMVVALLAIAKAGGVYVPLDPSYPEERLAFMMEDARLDALVTREDSTARLPAPRAHLPVVLLDGEAEAPAIAAAEGSLPRTSPEDIAYVIYTSGSTGRPKGVEVSNRGVVRLLFGTDYVRLSSEETILQLAPVSFDASTFEIWGALLHGGKLVLYPGTVPTAQELSEVLAGEAVSTLWLTASLFNAIVDEAPEALRPVRQLLVGGEALSVPHVARALRSLPDTTLVNGYGPTEGTTFTCCFPIPKEPPFLNGEARSIPIGRPIANTTVHLLDGELMPVPAGVVGELYIGGDGLALGYAGHPELTAEKFVPHPSPATDRPGDRLYRTGDLARFRRDGVVEFLGRTDDQVKVRGFRIELSEIELALSAHPDVSEAVVLLRQRESSDKQLVAHVVVASVSAEDLRSHLASRLPEYMVPAAIVRHDALPLSPNGKVDRRALAAIDPIEFEAGEAVGGCVPPRGPVEEALAEIWSEALGLVRERVGAHDSFFALGGHSLAAVKVLARIRESLRVEVPLRAVFESPTLSELASRVEEAMGSGGERALTEPVVAVPPSDPAYRKLSFAQQRLWLMDRLNAGGASYNVAMALRLEGPLSPEALEAALLRVVERHEALRTTIEADGKHQDVHAPSFVALAHQDLSAADDPEREAVRFAEEQARRPIDLVVGPLFSCTLLKLADDVHVLFWKMHHIVTDAWSVEIFHRELFASYRAAVTGEALSLPPVGAQYSDFAAWQARALDAAVLEKDLDYWRFALSGELVPTELPTDRKREVASSHRGARLSRTLPSSFSARLREVGRRQGVTTFMTLLAVFDLLLSRYAGRQDVVVGTPAANRARREIESTIGLFVNMLVLRVDLSGELTFTELLARVRECAVSAFAHQELPFERLVAELKPERRSDRTPFFQVAFALQNALGSGLELEEIRVTPLPVELTSSRFDFELHVWERGSEMGLVASYDADLYEETTVARLLEQYETLVDAALEAPDAPLRSLSMVSPSEREALFQRSRAEARYERDATLDALFAARVALAPDAIALRFGGDGVTYAELSRRAGRLAARLQSLGVGPDVRVGVYGERSLDLYVAVVAVTLAGGAYVPIDPSYPLSRVRFIVEDAKVAAIIASDSLRRSLPETNVPVVDWKEEGAHEEAIVFPSRPETLTASHLAYVVYTSGSTGTPKGVAVTHRGVHRLLESTNYIELTSSDRIAQAASFSFDAATFELWGALLSGACLVGIDKNLSLEPEAFGRELERFGVSVLFLTTALFNVMVREVSGALASLRVVLFGGESVDVGAVRACLRSGGPRELLHVYGPTESTTFASYHRVTSEVERARTVPIGGPIANTELYVVELDDETELCPFGAPGELLIGGDGLARAYVDRPELTAQSFVPHPWGAPGERLYRTGDVVRRLASGAIEFMGRRDGQIKLRGHRIELGEIEAALRDELGVCDATVVLREDAPGERRLVGYVVVEDPASFVPAMLRAGLEKRLPEYMVPQSFVRLDVIPLTGNGKVDRAALPGPESVESVASDESLTLPRDGIEESIAGLAREVLGLDRIGVYDNFFHLGGHSLLATELVSRVRKVFGVEIPLRDFFVAPTVEALAARVSGHDGEEALDASSPALATRSRDVGPDALYPVSLAQKRLWFVSELDPESAAYNMATAVTLSGVLDLKAFARAMADVVERHEILRALFVDVEGEPWLRLQPELPVDRILDVVDLAALPFEAREPEARRLVTESAGRAFDRGQGPLIRAQLIRLSEAEHVFQVVMDHLVGDGWSLGVLFRELGTAYRAYLEGQVPALPELSIQYLDFAAWQREWLTEDRREKQLEYWRRTLASDLPPLELPTDFRRPPRPSAQGGRVSRKLPVELVRSLRGVAQEANATLFMTLLAGFDALVHRYSGQTDIVVGTPIANRTRMETEALIGFFANSLVIRADLSGDPAFFDLVERIREAALGAYAHQDVPFELLVEDLQPERDLGRNPIFQATFALQSAPLELALSGLTWRAWDQKLETARFDLELNVWETATGIEIVAFYRSDLFRNETVERLLAHYERLLEAAVTKPSTALSSLSILDPSEREKLVGAWSTSPKAAELPSPAVIHRLFEARVGSSPGAVAVVSGEERMSYEELNRRANRLARKLQELGVSDEERVGVFLERSPSMVTTLLAVLKAGGVYVPLDPDYPEARLRFMLEDSKIRVVVTEDGLRARLPSVEAETLCLDDDGASFEAYDVTNLPTRATAASLAYVIYTSGSTGTPKGVEVPHRGVVRLLFGTDYTELGPETTILQLAPVSFDASTFEIWGALLHGGRLVLYPKEVPSAEGLHDILTREGVTTLWLTAALFNAVVDESPSSLASLRQLLVGGEALSVPHIQRAFEALPSTELINGYGPTEGTTFTCCYPIPRDGVGAGSRTPRSISIGRPIAHTEVYILDPDLEPVPAGVPGELYIGGAGLARGYADRPELTAASFVPSPFGEEPGERLYRTGDRARFYPDGRIEFLGRADHQVKVRGFRIELGEIEAVLTSCAGVLEAAVLVRQGEEASSQEHERDLCAYVVWDGTPRVSELRAFLKEKLPAYMIPSVYVTLESMPLTPNGKLDREALAALSTRDSATSSQDESDGYVAPRTPIEELVANEWARVLGLERVGVASDFFEVGGHSLLATQLVSRLRKAFGVEFPLSAAFELATVAEQAERIDSLTRSGSENADAPIVALAAGEPVLSYSQQRLWFFDQLDPGSSAYNMPFAMRMKGELDIEAFELAFRAVVNRHRVLRSVFGAASGRPVLGWLPVERFALRRVDLRSLPAPLRERQAESLARLEARQPFVLAEGPLVRCTLVSLEEEEHLLLLTIHHIVSDGWSMAILFEELDVASRAFARGERPSFSELPVQYDEFARWQRGRLDEGIASRQLEYWKQALEGAPGKLELPTDRPRPKSQTFRGGKVVLALSPELARELRALSRSEGATLFMTLLAAFQILLARSSGQSDVVVGTPIAGRNRAEIEPLIGFFVNTLVLRASIEDDPTFRELLGRVRESALGAYAHQDLPFDRLVEELQPERDLSRTPLFQVMFNYLNLGGSRLTLSNVTVDAPSYIEPDSKFDLTLYAGEEGDALELTLVYNRDLFDRRRMEEMLAQLEVLLQQAAVTPDTRARSFSLLTGKTKHLLPDPEAPMRARPAIAAHEQFEEQARLRPEALAVSDGSASFRYGELSTASSRLAHFLRERGIGEGDTVAVYAHRSAALAWALLGVWKAGAAFLVLDPAYPPRRLASCVRSARARALVRLRAAGTVPEELATSLADAVSVAEIELGASFDEGSSPSLDDYPDFPPTSGPVAPDAPAYVAFTSGSTGAPKGILGTHGPVAHFLEWYRKRFDLRNSDRFAMTAGLSYDPLLRDLFAPLSLGATLAVPAQEVLEQGRLRAWMKEQGTTVAHLTPALGRLLASQGEPSLQALRYGLFGGESATGADVECFATVAPNATFVNVYGTTETPQVMGYFIVDGAQASSAISKGAPVPIGKGIEEVDLLVLTPKGKLAGVGELGEICVRTPHLSKGYLDDDALTRKRFPVVPEAGEAGLYRTGDLGRYLPDGNVVLVGRSDDQVKLRGFRIELGEIEAVLQRHPQAGASCVLCREDREGEPRLVAYVAGDRDEALVSELEAHLAQELPTHMLPTHLVFVPTLPLTPNGKLDRGALPAPEDYGEADFEPPQTPVELGVAEIWRTLLGVAQVGLGDNFFKLGGHSLLATQVVSRIRDTFGVELPLRLLFERPTAGAIASAVSEALVASGEGSTEMEEMLAEIDGLSEEEIEAKLSELRLETTTSNPGEETSADE